MHVTRIRSANWPHSFCEGDWPFGMLLKNAGGLRPGVKKREHNYPPKGASGAAEAFVLARLCRAVEERDSWDL